MPLIENFNYDEVPDEIPQVNPGLRVLDIDDVEPVGNPEGNTIYNVTFSVNEPDAEDNGVKMWNRFDFKYPRAMVGFKKMCKSAGVSGHPIDTADLIGCTVKATVVAGSYPDKNTGETVETRNIKRFHSD